ncbi:unnamed protein product [Echinostoma caproni]|uniref:Membrane protein UL56 n=1 Tax=Echinostoma caproni TaxID=27848 RepID=A0A183AV13_9TREM|nr:unnamed protein product [Echinostoma caproni]
MLLALVLLLIELVSVTRQITTNTPPTQAEWSRWNVIVPNRTGLTGMRSSVRSDRTNRSCVLYRFICYRHHSPPCSNDSRTPGGHYYQPRPDLCLHLKSCWIRVCGDHARRSVVGTRDDVSMRASEIRVSSELVYESNVGGHEWDRLHGPGVTGWGLSHTLWTILCIGCVVLAVLFILFYFVRVRGWNWTSMTNGVG